MKTRVIALRLAVIALLGSVFSVPPAIGADACARREAPPKSARIAVFDSRALAYAYFWSEAYQQDLHRRVDAAERVRQSGDETLFKKSSRQLLEEQKHRHLQVFSTAPVDDILAGMSDHIAALRREIGFTWLISKWDQASLALVADAEQVDVTLMLVACFPLSEERSRVLRDLLRHEPVPEPVLRALLERDPA